MARLKGDLTSIDLMVPFSTRPGGRVFDLSKDLHFEVMWDGANVIERFTGDILNGSGHVAAPAPNSHTGFMVNGIANFPNLISNLSWANDEFTLAFWVKFHNTGFTSSTPFFGDRQFDFIGVKKTIGTIPGYDWVFSTQLKRNIAGTGSRAYFGLQNFDLNFGPNTYDFSLNFCDTYNNESIGQYERNRYASLDYPSENINGEDLLFDTWHHIVIRSKTRKNNDIGICDLWLDGKLICKYVPCFLDFNNRQPDKNATIGSGILGAIELSKGGKIIVYAKDVNTGEYDGGLTNFSNYPDYVYNNSFKFYLSNHSFYQLAKWDRILEKNEIEALYNGTLNNVYVERFTSYSSPPRKRRNASYDYIQNDNFGYIDSSTPSLQSKQFNESKIINRSLIFMGKNIPINLQGGEEHLELSKVIESNVIQNGIQLDKIETINSFNEKNTKEIFICLDNTTASSVVDIDISSVYREDNLQYAGRTDSKFSKTISNEPQHSMFLSSALYRDEGIPNSFFDSGIAGTGFLYYSPIKKCWIEKRPQHETSRGVNTYILDSTNARNALEINPYTVSDSDGGFISTYSSTNYNDIREEINVPVYTDDNDVWYSSKIQLTGSHDILRQFTASPQLGYFTNNKEDLERMGYTNIGSPTVAFGAPFSPKYHAFDNETIKMKNFIDGPFSLKKAILRIPVEIRRKNELNLLGAYEEKYKPVAYFNFEDIAISPNTVDDLTGNGHIATLINYAQVIDTDTPANITGRGCLDLSFDALLASDTDNLTIDDAPDLRLSSSGLSISLWVKFSTFTTNQSIFYKTKKDGSDSEYSLYYEQSTDKLIFTIFADSTSYQQVHVPNVIANNYFQVDKWHHVVATFGGTMSSPGISMKIYIDGVNLNSGGVTSVGWGFGDSARSYTYDLIFGSRGEFPGSDLRGKIASITIWNRNLITNDILAIYSNCLNSIRYSWNWTKNVVNRKDIDNYVFFLYRQRRTNETNVVDSTQDISSSERFLIGSGSVCLYNSSSFGLSKDDGFIDIFGINTPITGTNTSGLPFRDTLNNIFRTSSDGKNPYAGVRPGASTSIYTKVSSPLHGPAVSIDAGLDSSGDDEYIEKRYLEIEINPSFNLGGFANNTLMYVTTSNGFLSTSFYSISELETYDGNYANKLFNWYPQKGKYDDIGNACTPPITTIFQNFWFGGTRQPRIILSESGGYSNGNFDNFMNCEPHYQFDNRENYLSNNNSMLQKNKKTSVEFDIEIARTGLSFFSLTDDIFAINSKTANDSRGRLTSLSKDYKNKIAAVFQRTELIQAASYNDETTNYLTGTFSIKTGLENSTFVDLLTSLTIGYAPVANRTLSVYNPYTILPEDELVLGLDAGVTPPPDIAPYFGKNMTDSNESGQHKAPNEAFINPVLKEQIWHYAGNSYIKILPGEAKLLLVGDYVRNEKAIERNRSTNSTQISTVIGNEPLFDTYNNSETDAYVSTLVAQVFSGSMSDGTRRVIRDDARKNSVDIHTMKRNFEAYSSTIIIEDLYVSGTV